MAVSISLEEQSWSLLPVIFAHVFWQRWWRHAHLATTSASPVECYKDRRAYTGNSLSGFHDRGLLHWTECFDDLSKLVALHLDVEALRWHIRLQGWMRSIRSVRRSASATETVRLVQDLGEGHMAGSTFERALEVCKCCHCRSQRAWSIACKDIVHDRQIGMWPGNAASLEDLWRNQPSAHDKSNGKDALTNRRRLK